tara:strand:- start:512 stop:736 length:225 start_codon:yes stop_codon:yes gene_type:complete
MTGIVAIRVSPVENVRYSDSGDQSFNVGDSVLVDDKGNLIEGVVVVSPTQVIYADLNIPLSPVLHKLGVDVVTA